MRIRCRVGTFRPHRVSTPKHRARTRSCPPVRVRRKTGRLHPGRCLLGTGRPRLHPGCPRKCLQGQAYTAHPLLRRRSRAGRPQMVVTVGWSCRPLKEGPAERRESVLLSQRCAFARASLACGSLQELAGKLAGPVAVETNRSRGGTVPGSEGVCHIATPARPDAAPSRVRSTRKRVSE